jgi:hypothetical protein
MGQGIIADHLRFRPKANEREKMRESAVPMADFFTVLKKPQETKNVKNFYIKSDKNFYGCNS